MNRYAHNLTSQETLQLVVLRKLHRGAYDGLTLTHRRLLFTIALRAMRDA